MEHPQPDRDVGSSIPIPAILASVVALALIVGGFYGYRMVSGDQAQHEIVIATGPDTGTYHALGQALARVLEDASVVASAEVLSTGGSVENMERIDGAGGGADLAFVQSDTPVGNNARLVAPLYNEVLHILVSRLDADEIRSIYDLRGRRVSLGPAGSGTRQLSKRVLEHFGAEIGEDLALLPADATAGLIDGSVDAAFILNAIPSRMVTELAEKDAIRFLSLGDAQEFGNESDALALVFPSIASAARRFRGRRTYGCRRSPCRPSRCRRCWLHAGASTRIWCEKSPPPSSSIVRVQPGWRARI